MSSNKTSIIIDKKIRDHLRQIGRKNQTYDDILIALIKKWSESP
jgi:hypothetical protein